MRKKDKSVGQLVTLSASGDEEAYEKLFHLYSQKLYNFIYYLVYSREESEDIVQESFISVFNAIQGRDVSSFNFQAYLYKTAKNFSLQALARRKKEGLTLDEAMEFEDTNIYKDPERAALLAEQRSAVMRASGELTDEQEIALLLKEVEGFRYEAIAEVLDSNPNAVGALLSRARLSFREVYRMAHAQAQGLSDTCAQITPLLSKYIDKEASPDEVMTVEAHLADCPICNANLVSMREASVTYRSLIPILPLAALKVSGIAKVALVGGKAAAHLAGATGGGGSSAGGAASAGAFSTMASSLAGKITAVVAATLIAAGAGTGVFFAVHKPAPKYYSVAFVRVGDIWTAQLDENYKLVPETEVDITLSPESESEPRFSPDGKKILYIRNTEEYLSVPAKAGFVNYDEVCSIDNVGGKPNIIVSKTRSVPTASPGDITHYKYSSPMWVPGTTKILYAKKGMSWASYWIDEFDCDNKKTSRVQEGPSMGFDVSCNKEVAYTFEWHGANEGGFVIIPLDGTSVVQRLAHNSDGRCVDPAWLPDGTRFSAIYGNSTKFIDRKGNVVKEAAITNPEFWLDETIGLFTKDNGTWLVDTTAGTEKQILPDISVISANISNQASVEQSRKAYSSDEQQIVRLFAKRFAEPDNTSEYMAVFGGLKISNDGNWADVRIPNSLRMQGGQIIYKKENGKWVYETECGEMLPEDYPQCPPEILTW